ncbi:hypothetical protein CL633_04390 [bacterium]|jgi:hypothetical protein|nr:hypothetical protein [bacterium]|tara:strand:+ start:779 stop:970 length:192 start_codon:yes stop_codon:yes gene_type:complete
MNTKNRIDNRKMFNASSAKGKTEQMEDITSFLKGMGFRIDENEKTKPAVKFLNFLKKEKLSTD